MLQLLFNAYLNRFNMPANFDFLERAGQQLFLNISEQIDKRHRFLKIFREEVSPSYF